MAGNHCYVDTGPPFIVFLHPALGPLWDVVRQKVQLYISSYILKQSIIVSTPSSSMLMLASGEVCLRDSAIMLLYGSEQCAQMQFRLMLLRILSSRTVVDDMYSLRANIHSMLIFVLR